MNSKLKALFIGEFSWKRLIRSMVLIPICVVLGLFIIAVFFADKAIFRPQRSSYKDTAEVIKARLEKTRLEREIAQKFAELGSKLYEKAVREGKEAGILQEPEVQAIIEDLKRMDRELAHTHALMEQEMEKQVRAT